VYVTTCDDVDDLAPIPAVPIAVLVRARARGGGGGDGGGEEVNQGQMTSAFMGVHRMREGATGCVDAFEN